MPRLPTPVIDEIEVVPLEDNRSIKTFYKMIGIAIRKAEMIEKKKGGKGKDETD